MQSQVTSDRVQFEYWMSPVTRRELQTTLDSYTQTVNEITAGVEQLSKLAAAYAMSIAFLMERIGATPEEFIAYQEKKKAEFEALETHTHETTHETTNARRKEG